jgi:hypothetical protein
MVSAADIEARVCPQVALVIAKSSLSSAIDYLLENGNWPGVLNGSAMVRRLVQSLLLRPVARYNTEVMMNEDVFNTSIRKFLKRLGVTAQREIEKVVRQGLAEGKLKGNERLPAEATVTLGEIGLSLEIKGEIELDE